MHQMLLDADQAVRNGMSQLGAWKHLGVPKTILVGRCSGRIGMDVTSSGPPSILTNTEEDLLKKSVIDMGKV